MGQEKLGLRGLSGAGQRRERLFVTGPSIGQGSSYDYYTAKHSGTNGSVIWEKRYTGAGENNDFPRGLAVDFAGDVVVTGETAYFGGVDIYTVRYSGANGAVLWSQQTPGEGEGVTVDSAGNAYVVGQEALSPVRELYTVKYASATGSILWEKNSTLWTSFSSSYQQLGGVAVDPSNGANIPDAANCSRCMKHWTTSARATRRRPS